MSASLREACAGYSSYDKAYYACWENEIDVRGSYKARTAAIRHENQRQTPDIPRSMLYCPPRAIGATVSAGALHAQGWGFESLIAHHRKDYGTSDGAVSR